MFDGYATINGKQYSSDDQPSFDVIVDGRPAAPLLYRLPRLQGYLP